MCKCEGLPTPTCIQKQLLTENEATQLVESMNTVCAAACGDGILPPALPSQQAEL
jgi:hypothetical protein